MGFARPIGPLRRARRAVRDQRNLLDVLLDSLDVAVVACDADGRLTHANRRTLELGQCPYPRGLHADKWVERFRVRTADGHPFPTSELPLVRALRGEVVRGVDVIVDAGGADLRLACSATPVEDDAGLRLGAVVVLEDVTEQRDREARMLEELGDLGIALEIEEAAAAGRLVLHAQPIVCLKTGETVLEELLLRMRSPDGTIV